MKYNYDIHEEAFVREDKLGKKYWINMNEAQRIMTLHDLGYNPNQIGVRMQFNNKKVTISTIKNFIKQVEKGKIIIDMNAPASLTEVEDMSVDARISRLEENIQIFNDMIESPDKEKSFTEKVRGYLRL